MHVFISYAKVDTRALALRIRDYLLHLPNVTAWMDESLESGESWATQIEDEIIRCDLVVVLLSPDVNRTAATSPTRTRSFVLTEIDFARQIHKPILPIMAKQARIPLQLAGIQFIDLTQDEEAGLRQLVRRLNRTEGAALPPPMPTPRGRRVSPLLVVGAALVAVIVLIGLLWVNRPHDTTGITITLTTSLDPQAAQLVTDTSAHMIDTLVANMIALTATAAVPTIDPLAGTQTVLAATAMSYAGSTQTAAAQTLTEQVLTQNAQAAQAIATNTVPPATPTPSITPSPIPISTLTPTHNPTEIAVAATEIYNEALVLYAEQERVQKAALNITAAFDGGSYDALTIDPAFGLLYGRFNFSLAEGSLRDVLTLYLDMADTPIEDEIRLNYYARAYARNNDLSADPRFSEVLIAAAQEAEMRLAQDQIAIEKYWNVTQQRNVEPRRLITPLAHALFFDMAIQFGPYDPSLVVEAERALSVLPGSVIGENGITEEQLLTKLVELYGNWLDDRADRSGRPKLHERADFWRHLIEQGDWQLRGDANGEVEPLPGVVIQVRDL